MDFIRFKTVLMATILVALASGMGATLQARDASLCASGGVPAGAAEAGAGRCLDLPDAADAATGAKSGNPVLQSNKPGPSSVIPGPVTRTGHFVYRWLRPEVPSGETIVLLHGSGGDEASLFRLAARIAPDATLLGVRGRVVQKGIKRWYARVTPTRFDQADIRNEARAFAKFLTERMAAEKLDLDRAVFIGYSNGANLIAALTLLHPDLVQRAVLLRAMPVLDTAPAADLKGTRFLSVAGERDKIYGPFAPELAALLRAHGAVVDTAVVARGHFLGDEDVKVVSDWLKAANAVAGGAADSTKPN
jgi:phospholipase/carboxylesterase